MYNFTITIEGTSPLLMHNGRLANPLDPVSKALKKVTSKQRLTDDDQLEKQRLQFLGSLYIDEDLGPHIPGDNIWRFLYDAAKKTKMGVKVKEGVIITTDVNPLSYGGPRDAASLWADENYRFVQTVVINRSRVPSCRPIFRNWKVEADGILDPKSLDPSVLESIAETAGNLIGLGDWRPRYGRCVTEVKPR